MPIPEEFAVRLLPILESLVKAHGTPFHVYDARGIVETYWSMVSAFSGEPFRQYFAVKALPNPNILALLLAEGSGLDCSSPAELALAERVGAVNDDIVFTSNNTTVDEYHLALKAGALVTFDDRSLLEKVDVLPEIVAFRVSPQAVSGGSRLMGDAVHSKFGVPAAELVDVYSSARERGATRFGIHGMAIANELDVDRAVNSGVSMIELGAQVASALGVEMAYVNVGGGLGIPYLPEQHPVDFNRYAQALIAARDRVFPKTKPKILMECGRFVTGPYGVLVTRVVNRSRKGREIVGLDASMSALMRPAMYPGSYHHITVPLATGRPEARFDVVGSLCENMDKFATDRALSEPQEGDIVLIHDTGAHGHAMGFTYNGRLRPSELLLTEDGNVVEIRRAESFRDYIATARWRPKPVLIRDPAAPNGQRA